MGAKENGDSSSESTGKAPAEKASQKGRDPRRGKKAPDQEGQAQDEAPHIETKEDGQAQDQAQDEEQEIECRGPWLPNEREPQDVDDGRSPKQRARDGTSKGPGQYRTPKQSRRYRTHNRQGTEEVVGHAVRGHGGIGGRGRRT